jgi:hypothetical protein
MTAKVFTLDTQPGVQRDGTFFDKNTYVDGRWVRFQRGRPRKIAGYRSMTNQAHGLSRGVYVNSEDGFNRIFSGYSAGLETFAVDNNGIGAGLTPFTFGGAVLTLGAITGGTTYTNGTYTNVSLTGGTGTGAKATITIATNTVTTVAITAGGTGYVVGDSLSATAASIGGTGSGFSVPVATVQTGFTASNLNLWQFDAMYDAAGSFNTLLLAHPGQNLAQIDSTAVTPVLSASVLGSVTTPLKDINGANPTGNLIEVSGGVVVLHPYVFVYGDNGLIKNSAAGDPFDWNSAESNEVSAASTKIVKGLPVRGGSNSPSGLFWSLDSLIRVSYAPQSLGVAGTGNWAPSTYWRYDTISTQSSILSSQSVIEYDGIYYWAGVDRFLLYNGVVKEIPNSMNQNYFFDNLNYAQRQKVWATKVPRFGEIWWFYPHGDSEECNNCIIYNVRENTWYDAGFSPGASRSAGYFSQVFKYPVNAGTNLTTEEPIFSAEIDTTNASADIEMAETNQIALNQVVNSASIPSGAYVIAIAPSVTPGNITVTLSANATATNTETAEFVTMAGLTTIWQHEIGTDAVDGESFVAIESYFETSDLGWVAGGPAQSPQFPSGSVGENKWLHIERIEPDFVQNGEMYVQVVGRPYAQVEDVYSQQYVFTPSTGKIDMREQRRLGRLKFGSNVTGGNYQMGRVLINANFGDVRGFN